MLILYSKILKEKLRAYFTLMKLCISLGNVFASGSFCYLYVVFDLCVDVGLFRKRFFF